MLLHRTQVEGGAQAQRSSESSAANSLLEAVCSGMQPSPSARTALLRVGNHADQISGGARVREGNHSQQC
ncbi:hypothetical protein VV01_10745 [Luteipulveratus halotolerans]|uniref:Uncharacterized protein n=1 Tax=Luteipulveratus halotolerans TaxID=1631356 RepID=A0A0L6CIH6_9MICO|nr:hypothetical protein VV01_10745 [Luteipulveratus halotolerans]